VLDRFRRSFSAKVSGLFVLLLLGLGMAIAVLCVRSAIRYMAEADQKLNRTLAAELAPRFEPHLTDGVDHAAVDSVIRSITGVNRRIEIYLLDEEGRVKALLGEPGRKLARRRVDLGPIWRFTEGAMLPIMEMIRSTRAARSPSRSRPPRRWAKPTATSTSSSAVSSSLPPPT
jgi:hypothetical protein